MSDNAVVVKGMRMPGNCYDCDLLYDCCSCIVTCSRMNFEKMGIERLSDCPLDTIDHFLATTKMVPAWISVKEALPAVNERVLVCVDYGDERGVWDSCRWNGKEWECEQEEIYDYWTSVDFPVTHWMATPPLPPPPEAVNAQKEERDDA